MEARRDTLASGAAQWAKDNRLVAPNMAGVVAVLHTVALDVSRALAIVLSYSRSR